MSWPDWIKSQLSVRIEHKNNGRRDRKSSKFFDSQKKDALRWMRMQGFFSADDYLNAAFKGAADALHESRIAKKARGED